MGQLSRELYLTVREYSLGLSKKANLEKQQPTNLNSRCLQEVVGGLTGGCLFPMRLEFIPCPSDSLYGPRCLLAFQGLLELTEGEALEKGPLSPCGSYF